MSILGSDPFLLTQFAKQGHERAASVGFEEALRTLTGHKALMPALRLLRVYGLLSPEAGIELSFNKTAALELVATAVSGAGDEISQNEPLRTLILLVSEQFPQLKRMIGLNGHSERQFNKS